MGRVSDVGRCTIARSFRYTLIDCEYSASQHPALRPLPPSRPPQPLHHSTLLFSSHSLAHTHVQRHTRARERNVYSDKSSDKNKTEMQKEKQT